MKMRCPDEEWIADYVEGRLSDKKRLELETHISDCETCMENLVIAKALMRREDMPELESVPSHVTRSAIHLVTTLDTSLYHTIQKKLRTVSREISANVSDFLLMLKKPEPVMIRGSEKSDDEDCVRKHFHGTDAEIDAEIEIEKIRENSSHIRVNLKASKDSDTAIRVSLKKGDRETASFLSVDGYVIFENIAPGRYELIFTRHGISMGSCALEISESENENN